MPDEIHSFSDFADAGRTLDGKKKRMDEVLNKQIIVREQICNFLRDRLKLRFSKSEIFPIASGLDFVGYRHFPDFILLRKRTCKKVIARMLNIGAMRDVPIDCAEKFRGQVAAAHGWLKFACSYNLRKKLRFESLKNKVGIM
ncbi:MAG: hypothetical protein FWG18_02825 [Alphaproteobacteria bacterium]|nr:hypothetical protein [Alphaproteobacteria bacterium]